MSPTLKNPEAAALRAAILRYLMGRCRDGALADDLAQDVLERVVRAMRLTEVRDPTALAYRVADNLLIDHHRSAARRTFAVLSPEQAGDEADPAQSAEARADLVRVIAALHAMPAQRRRIFLRRRYDGASCGDIAREFGITVKAVEKHITKALAELATALEQTGERE